MEDGGVEDGGRNTGFKLVRPTNILSVMGFAECNQGKTPLGARLKAYVLQRLCSGNRTGSDELFLPRVNDERP